MTAGALRAELPDDIYWLADKVASLVRPGAFFSQDPERVAAPGSTRSWGYPDLPQDAAWARSAADETSPWGWSGSPYDGESFWLQLNLQEIPEQVRKPEWPRAGVVWLFLDLRDWTVKVQYDPRPAAEIPWRPRSGARKQEPRASAWAFAPTLPYATPETLPEIFSWDDMCGLYDDWAWQHYMRDRQRHGVQVGGWMCPIQGDSDDCNRSLVVAMEDQGFGDCGAVYLHYTPQQGFYAFAETC